MKPAFANLMIFAFLLVGMLGARGQTLTLQEIDGKSAASDPFDLRNRRTLSPLEADLGWIVGWNKGDFLGAETLRQQKSAGVARKLVGFEMLERGIARQGYEALVGGNAAGRVTSGTQTPFLKKAIGLVYLPVEHTGAGTEFEIDIRGRRTRAAVVPLPFYKRNK